MLVDITVNIDYPDEDIEEMTYEKLEENISLKRSDMIEKLLATSSTGRMIQRGNKNSHRRKAERRKILSDEWSSKGNTRYRDGYSRYDKRYHRRSV